MTTHATLNISGGQGLYTNPPINTLSAGGQQMGLVDELAHLSGRGISIRIVPATGGTIIAIRDENAVPHRSDLYVVSTDQDIGQEIGKIITMHYLKT